MTDSLQDVVAAYVCGMTPGMNRVNLQLDGPIPEWADLGCQVRLSALAVPFVPEWFDEQCAEFLRVAFRHNDISGLIDFNDIRMGIKRANALSPGRSGEKTK